MESAFGTTLGLYQWQRAAVRLANSTLSIPASLAAVVAGVEGVNQWIATTDQEPAPPAGFPQPSAVLRVLRPEDRHR